MSPAIVDNATAMKINPAGLCDCRSPELGLGGSYLKPELRPSDSLGNNVEAERKFSPLPLLTCA